MTDSEIKSSEIKNAVPAQLNRTDFSPELQILLAALAPGDDAARTARLEPLLARDLNWTYLLQLARRHGVAPLLRARLQACSAATALPEAVAAELKRDHLAVAALALHLTRELERVLTLLNEHSIPVMPYKGVFLAEQLYGDAGLRPTEDIDIIVPQADVMRAVQGLMTELGYAPDYAFHSERQETVYLRQIHHYGLTHPRSRLRIEVHWDLAAPATGFAVDWAEVWVRAVPDVWHAKSVMLPAVEDHLLFLAIHGGKEQWRALRWLVDVGELLAQAPHQDWGVVYTRAEEWHAVRAVDLALLLCRTLFGVQVSRQSAAAATVLAEQIAAELDEPAAPPKSDWQRLNYQLQLQDRQADRLRMAWNWLFGLNFQDVPRSDASGLAAYAHRPVRLLRKRGVGGAASILKQTARGLWS